MWSWTVDEQQQLFLVKAGASLEPSAESREGMRSRWPEEAAETYLRCNECNLKFVRVQSHPMAGAATNDLRPCTLGKWLEAVDD